MRKTLLFKITKKDFKIEWFSGTGGGGQYRNKHPNCCRMTHLESGVIKTGQSNRSRPQNQKEAFQNIIEDSVFKKWHKKKCSEMLLGKDYIERQYNEMCKESNFKYEVRINGKWCEVDKDLLQED